MLLGYLPPYLHLVAMTLGGLDGQHQVLVKVQLVPRAVALPANDHRWLGVAVKDLDELYMEDIFRDLPNQIDRIAELHYLFLAPGLGNSFSPNGNHSGVEVGKEGFEVNAITWCLRRSSLGLRPLTPRKGRGAGTRGGTHPPSSCLSPFHCVAMSTSKRPEIDSASFEELSALAWKLDLQLATVGEFRLLDANEARLVIMAVQRAAFKAFNEGR